MVEFRLRTRSGGWRWILGPGMVVEHDDAGRPVRMVGTHTDITERRRPEEKLRSWERARARIIRWLKGLWPFHRKERKT